MKAAVIREHGDLEQVQVEDVAAPSPAPNEVVVDVQAAALNHLDIWVRRGRPGMELEMPHVLGSDACGTITDVGSDVHGLRTGDDVVLNPGLSCGCCEYCLRGEQSECPSFGVVGLNQNGTFAERVAVPAVNVRPKPPHLGGPHAAALTLAHLTAWRMLINRADLTPGETVLIHGIGGGVALAALQIGVRSGAEVIATSSSDEKLTTAAEMGAAHCLDYEKTSDLAGAIIEASGGRGVDIAVDAVGADTWPLDFSTVRRGGRVVLCGVTTGRTARTDLHTLYWNQLTVLGSTLGSQEEFRQMLKAVGAWKLEPVVDTVEPLDNVRDAMRRMEEGNQFGKIVLQVE